VSNLSSSRPPLFWVRWLTAAASGILLIGLGMVVAPELTRQVFGVLLYGDRLRVAAFDAAALSYISLLHGVLGAVMFGWATALLLVIRGPYQRGSREGWNIVAFAVLTWFIVDTAMSLWLGFWQNALLNGALALLFAVPLALTYRACRQG
jgi:hypothetical protein